MQKHLASVLFLLAAASTTAHADSKMEVGAFAGLHLWNDNNELGNPATNSNEINNSPIFGMRLAMRLSSVFSAEGELGISPGETKTSHTDVVALGYRLHLLVHPARFVNEKLEPFVLLGFGGMTSSSSDQSALQNDSDFTWHGGVGFKYRVGRDWGLRFDARLLLPPANEGLVTVDGEFLLGFYKTFPPAAAPPPVVEAPPPPPPVVEAPPPPPPPADTDGDGIPDSADKCVDQPEDVDGFQDQDGCADPDNDNDGVADAADHCPDQLETKNGYQDDDGCPDEPPAAVKKFTGAIKGIDFTTGSDKLTASSSRTLDEALEVLTEFSTIKLEISGHTDSTGDATKNRDLSRRRAESVKAYFVKHGIAAERLDAVGYGPDQPIADNATAQGRAKNRRVEFKLK